MPPGPLDGKQRRSPQNAAPKRMAPAKSGRAASDAQSARPLVRRPKTTHKK